MRDFGPSFCSQSQVVVESKSLFFDIDHCVWSTATVFIWFAVASKSFYFDPDHCAVVLHFPVLHGRVVLAHFYVHPGRMLPPLREYFYAHTQFVLQFYRVSIQKRTKLSANFATHIRRFTFRVCFHPESLGGHMSDRMVRKQYEHIIGYVPG